MERGGDAATGVSEGLVLLIGGSLGGRGLTLEVSGLPDEFVGTLEVWEWFLEEEKGEGG